MAVFVDRVFSLWKSLVVDKSNPNILKLAAMKGALGLLALTAVLCGSATGDGLSDYASLKKDYGRVFHPAGDLKMTETRAAPSVLSNQKKSPRGQVVYGKPIFIEQPPRQRTSNKKFRPSPEDPYAGSEYAPLYYQKYANQLYTAQKNIGQLSEYQKYIINQDPEVKKFVYSPRVPKKIIEQSTAASIVLSTTARPTSTEKIKIPKEEIAKLKQRKNQAQIQAQAQAQAQAQDSAAQSTAYKFVYKPEYYPVYAKDAFQVYEQDIPVTTVTQYTPTYASASHLTLAEPVSYKIPSYEVKTVEEYPTKEPKYEFKYEVRDHEKNSHFGHAEARKGKTTWGKYYVQLSDGRFETVKYWADKTGYHAEVDFKGQAKHPQTKPKEDPVALSYTADDLKLYGHDASAHQFYAVSEASPIAYR